MENNNADPQITRGGKITAGILLVVFTVFSIILIMAFWPDRLPDPGKKCALYKYDWFDMKLAPNACLPDTTKVDTTIASTKPATTNGTTASAGIDSLTRDSIAKAALAQKPDSPAAKAATAQPKAAIAQEEPSYIHLNIILLLLVAAGGFLGNMIHIATSFTTFVGAGKFQQSWILWYWVRPFTASALALALYFAFGASSDPGNVDIDRVLTVSILAGLFTDVATQKLKEVFDVIFNPKDSRPNKLTDPKIKVTAITPDELAKEGENKIIIKGNNLKSQKLAIKIDDQLITNPLITDEQISFAYTVPDEAKEKSELALVITDEEGNTVFPKKMLPVTENTAPAPAEGTEDAEEKPVG